MICLSDEENCPSRQCEPRIARGCRSARRLAVASARLIMSFHPGGCPLAVGARMLWSGAFSAGAACPLSAGAACALSADAACADADAGVCAAWVWTAFRMCAAGACSRAGFSEGAGPVLWPLLGAFPSCCFTAGCGARRADGCGPVVCFSDA